MFSTCFAASLVALRLLSIERVPACFACLQQEFEVVRQESLGTVISLVPVVHFNVLKCRGKRAVGRELSWDTMKTVCVTACGLSAKSASLSMLKCLLNLQVDLRQVKEKIRDLSFSHGFFFFFLSFPFGLLIGSVGLLLSKGAFQSQKLLFSFRNLPSHIYFPPHQKGFFTV